MNQEAGFPQRGADDLTDYEISCREYSPGPVTRTTVYVNDSSDMPTLQFVETQHTVEERDTFVFIPIKRTGSNINLLHLHVTCKSIMHWTKIWKNIF